MKFQDWNEKKGETRETIVMDACVVVVFVDGGACSETIERSHTHV